MLMMHDGIKMNLTSYCKNWVTLKVNAMGEERIAVTEPRTSGTDSRNFCHKEK